MNTKSFSNHSGNLTQFSENIFLSAERLTPLPIQSRDSQIIEVPLSYALLYDRNDSSNILLRRGSDRSGYYGFAGGKHRAEERSIDCVTREVKEEVGIKIPTHHFVSLGVISIKDSIWSKKQAR